MVNDLRFHLGPTSTVAFLLLWLHDHPKKREICTHVSVMYTPPFPSMLMTVLRRIHVGTRNFCWNTCSCFVELKNHECMRVVMEKSRNFSPHTWWTQQTVKIFTLVTFVVYSILADTMTAWNFTDIYTLSPQACSPQALGVYMYQLNLSQPWYNYYLYHATWADQRVLPWYN